MTSSQQATTTTTNSAMSTTTKMHGRFTGTPLRIPLQRSCSSPAGTFGEYFSSCFQFPTDYAKDEWNLWRVGGGWHCDDSQFVVVSAGTRV